MSKEFSHCAINQLQRSICFHLKPWIDYEMYVQLVSKRMRLHGVIMCSRWGSHFKLTITSVSHEREGGFLSIHFTLRLFFVAKNASPMNSFILNRSVYSNSVASLVFEQWEMIYSFRSGVFFYSGRGERVRMNTELSKKDENDLLCFTSMDNDRLRFNEWFKPIAAFY